MFNNILQKKNLVHLGAAAIFAVIALLYCSPTLQGKKLVQSDIVKFHAQSQAIDEFRDEHGKEPLWTSNVFSGMTTFNISTKFTANILWYLNKVIQNWLPLSAAHIFMIALGFYILLIGFGVNPWLAIVAAAGYSISSNLMMSLVAGHNTKVLSIAYLAPALGGVMLAYRGKHYLGGALAALFVGLMLKASHYQISYYFILCSGVIALIEFALAFRQKALPAFLRASTILLLAGIVGAVPNFAKVYNVYVHSKPTIRGGESELSQKKKEDKGGLDRDYAFSWSYGIMESFTTVIPSFMGGATGEALPEDGEVAEALKKFNVNRKQKEQILGNAPLYMGDQPFVQGTVYFGAAFIFLFILALVFADNRARAWLIGLTLMSFLIAWGRHAPFIANFLFDYLPFYNKFRTPSMALSIAGLAMPLLGLIGLQKVLSSEMSSSEFMKKFKLVIYISGGLMVFLLLYGLTSDWIGAKDTNYQGENSPWAIDELYQALLADRKSVYLGDWFMSTAIMAICGVLIWLYYKGKVKMTVFVAGLALIVIGDHWRVSKRYLNNDSFASERDYEREFQATPADQVLLADSDPHFRMLNLTRNPWTDGLSCYHHENVGGHHAAKLQRYQDLISRQLTPQLQLLQQGLRQGQNQIMLDPRVGSQLSAYNMLNTKYFIAKNNIPGGAVLNSSACGNAWFVSSIKKVSTAEEEISEISNINPRNTAIVHEEFSDALYNYSFGASDDANIQLTSFQMNELKYKTSNTQDGLAVFSEVFYPIGWEATIDGNPAEIYRVNYLLRAIKIPAGEHEVVMRFEPDSYSTGQSVSLAGSVLFLLFFGGMLFAHNKQLKTEDKTEA